MQNFNKDHKSEEQFVKAIEAKQLVFPLKREQYDDNSIKMMFGNLIKYDYKPRLIEVDTYQFKYPIIINKEKFVPYFKVNNIKKSLILKSNDSDYNDFNMLSDMYQEEERMKCSLLGKDSPHILFYKKPRELFQLLSKIDGKRVDTFSPNLRENIYNIKPSIECTTHRPANIMALIQYLLVDGQKKSKKDIWIYDSSAGWGDRLFGAMAANVNYIATDPNVDLHKNYEKMIQKHGNAGRTYKIFKHGSQTLDMDRELDQLYNQQNIQFDLMYTSPPYFNLETYSNTNDQSISLFSTENIWYENFLLPTLFNSWKYIKKDGYMAININYFNNNQKYISRMIEDVQKLCIGSDFMGVLSYANMKDGNILSSPQPIWIWKKIKETNYENLSNNIVTDVIVDKEFNNLIYKFFDSKEPISRTEVDKCLLELSIHDRSQILFEILFVQNPNTQQIYYDYDITNENIEFICKLIEIQNIYINGIENNEERLNTISSIIFDDNSSVEPINKFRILAFLQKNANRYLYLKDNIDEISNYIVGFDPDTVDSLIIETLNYNKQVNPLTLKKMINVDSINYYKQFIKYYSYADCDKSVLNIQTNITIKDPSLKELFLKTLDYFYLKTISNSFVANTNEFGNFARQALNNQNILRTINITSTANLQGFAKLLYLYNYELFNKVVPLDRETTLNIPKNKNIPSFFYYPALYKHLCNVKFNTEFNMRTYDDIKFNIPYISDKNFPRPILHIGQRKLFLNELQFLTETLKSHLDEAYVIYAGSAPSESRYLLLDLFPNVKFIFIDPSEHKIWIESRKPHYVYDTSHNIHNEIGYIHAGKFKDDNKKFKKVWKYQELNNKTYLQPAMLDFIKMHRISIIEDYYTKDLSIVLKGLHTHKTTKGDKMPVYFWSDIRTVLGSNEFPTDIDILWNSAMQVIWIYYLQPDKTMLKFKLPFGNLNDDSINISNKPEYSSIFNECLQLPPPYNIDFVSNFNDSDPSKRIFEYFDGSIWLQPRAPIITTETRLVFSKENIRMRYYNVKNYENKFTYLNLVVRPFQLFNNPIYQIPSLSNRAFEIGFDCCFDCMLEYNIWNDYFNKYTTQNNHEFEILNKVEYFSIFSTKTLVKDGHGKLVPGMLSADTSLFNETIPISLQNKENRLLLKYINTPTPSVTINIIEHYYEKYIKYNVHKKDDHWLTNQYNVYKKFSKKDDSIINTQTNISRFNNATEFNIFISNNIDSRNKLLDIFNKIKNIRIVNRWEDAKLIMKASLKEPVNNNISSDISELGIEKMYNSPQSGRQFIDLRKILNIREIKNHFISILYGTIFSKLQDEIKKIISDIIFDEANYDLDDDVIYNNIRSKIIKFNKTENTVDHEVKSYGITVPSRASYRVKYLLPIFSEYIESTKNIENRSYLDIGCGEGKITSAIGSMFNIKNIHGCDIVPYENPDFNFTLITDINKPYPYNDKSQDIITTFMALHHIRDMVKSIVDIYRMLKDDGIFIIREHDCTSPSISLMLDILHGLYAMSWNEEIEYASFKEQYSKYLSQYDMINIIENIGFKLAYITKPTKDIRSYYAVFVKNDNISNYFKSVASPIFYNINKPIEPNTKILNLFPDHNLITNKDSLYITYKQWCSQYNININNILPKTWNEINNSSIIEFTKLPKIIIKPRSSFGGQGIKVMNGKDFNLQVKDYNNYIVQEYITNVKTIKHLTKGYDCKFDLRVNIIVNSRGGIWIYNNMLLRVSDEEYDINSSNELVHITNFDKRQITNNSKRYVNLITPGENYDLSHNVKLFIMKYVIPVISEMVVKKYYDYNTKTFLYPNLTSFQRFGIDLIVTNNNEIKLLEINSNPGYPDEKDYLYLTNLWFSNQNIFNIPDNIEMNFITNRTVYNNENLPLNTSKLIYINPSYFDANNLTLFAYKTGFKIVDNYETADIIVKYKFNFDDDTYKNKVINKYPGDNTLHFKDKLPEAVKSINALSIIPQTINADDNNFDRSLLDENKLYIIKPSHNYGGIGIKLNYKNDINITTQSVIQEYIKNPQLLNGCKFDMRVNYILYNNEIYMYNSIMLRISDKKFDINNLDNNIHVTNLHGRETTQFNQMLLENTPRLDIKSINNKIIDFSKQYIKPLINKYVFESSKDIIEQQNLTCYAQFGIDILITDDMKLYLLEINNSPGTIGDITKSIFSIFTSNKLDTSNLTLI